MQYANTVKNGTARQKVQLHTLAEWIERHSQGQPLAMELVHDVAQGWFESVGEMLSARGNIAADLLGLLTAPMEGVAVQQHPAGDDEKRRRRRKKFKSRDVSR